MSASDSVDRYSKYPDKASYHRPPSIRDLIRTKWMQYTIGFKIGLNSKICRNAEIAITKGGKLEIGDYVTIADYAFLQLTKPNPFVVIGNHSVVGRNTIIAAKTEIKIGAFVLIGPYCQINDQSHGMSKSNLIINQEAILNPVKIEDDVWIGSGVRILPGVNIGRGSIIGAGSVVTKSIPEYEIWAGVPARFMRKRV